MRKIAILVVLTTMAATSTIAQEVQDEERMFVLLNYVTITPGMEQAFMAAAAGHLEWHRSSNDAHYYNAAEVVTGPRTGQFVWSAGPMSAAMLDDYDAFLETDIADWSSRGGMQYVEAVENHVYAIVAGLGNPPPPDYQASMVNIYEFDIEFLEMNTFMKSLTAFDALEAQIGHDDHFVWTEVVSGDSLTKRHYVQWADGWAAIPAPDSAREAQMAEASGGDAAYAELVENLLRGVKTATVHTIRNLPDLSFQPEGQ